jgi:HAD superfamily hydrolase (TIGR01549 family)
MKHVTTIGFDLFNTLITVEPRTLDQALDRLIWSLLRSGLDLEAEPFRLSYRDVAVRYVEEARKNGRETHNRFWLSTALAHHGFDIEPEDWRIAQAIEVYFSYFGERCSLIPDTMEMLSTLMGVYRLGLLSNFTHAPAAMTILNRLELTPFFDALLISGDLGYRKPHPLTFDKLADALKSDKERMLYIGDDPDADIRGALNAGIQPVWTTYVRDQGLSFPSTLFSSDAEEPNPSIPTISTWQDFLILLGEA